MLLRQTSIPWGGARFSTCPFLQCFALQRDVLSRCNGCSEVPGSPPDGMWREQTPVPEVWIAV